MQKSLYVVEEDTENFIIRFCLSLSLYPKLHQFHGYISYKIALTFPGGA